MLECYSNPFFALNSLSVMRWLKSDLIFFLSRFFCCCFLSFQKHFPFYTFLVLSCLVLNRLPYGKKCSCVNPICKKSTKKNCQTPSPVLCRCACARPSFCTLFHSNISFFDFFRCVFLANVYLFMKTNSIHIIPLREWIVSFSIYVQYNIMFGRKIVCLPFCTLIEQKIQIQKTKK